MSGRENIDQTSDAFQFALGHFQAGRTAEAAGICHQILGMNPQHPDALHMLGVIAYQAKTYSLAAELLSKAVLAAPNFAKAHFNLGNALKELGEPDAAIICYQNALALDPRYAKASNNLGDLLQGQGKLAEAIACYRAAIAIEPGLPEVHYNLGLALQAQGKLAEAIGSYSTALAIKPDYAEVRDRLADLRRLGTPARQYETLDALAEYFIENPLASTSGLFETFCSLLERQPEPSSSPAPGQMIHRKNRIDLFKAECRVDALGKERFFSRLKKQVDISALSSGASCQVTRFEELSPRFDYADSLSSRNDRPESLCNRTSLTRKHAVAALSDARLCITHLGFAVFDADDNFVDDVCWGDGVLYALADRSRLYPLQRFDGTVMPLCGVWGSEYFHWFLEILPRLILVLKAGYRLEDVDAFLVDRKLPHLMEFLEVLGIRQEQVVEWQSFPHLKASKLLLTSSPVNYNFSRPLSSILIEPWISQGLHRLYAHACGGKKKRRIYIDRESARYRKVANNAAVKDLLARYGFEFHCLESMSLQEKRELFSCAEMVVGPAGAGFSNLVLCNEGARVLILYQEDFATDSFWSICNNNCLVHFHQLCKAAGEDGLPKSSPAELNDDLLVDVSELEKSVRLMIDCIPQPAHQAGATE